ncbi:MAG: hypothetical protein U5J95_04585 [Balneolaceae bacterium]|nr:hypothetical protein [Balneolaceae bacterium]
MNTYTKYSNKYFILIATILSLVIISCSNPASSEEEHELEAEGAVLILNGQEVVRYEDGTVTGQLEVDEGQETALISIFFLDHDGDQFQPDEPEFSLNWRDINTSIADIEQHNEDGKWRFHLHGEAQGNTTVIFQLFHNDHADFETASIPVVVN